MGQHKITYHSTILLSQSHLKFGTCTVTNNHPRALLSGHHLSQKHELLTIIPVSATSANDENSTREKVPILKYNDIISFEHDCKFLGTRGLGEIGFYRSFRGQAEQWKILPAASLLLYNTISSPVLAGDEILLQNELTGELLSSHIKDESEKTETKHDLGTNGDEIRDATSRDRFLTLFNFQAEMDQNRTMDAGLQLTFGREEIWVLDLVHTPPMPKPDYDSRPFLSGRYLDFDKRHQLDPKDKDYPFRDGVGVYRRGTGKDRGVDLDKYDVNVQNSVLVEEVLGALFGLEGNYVKFMNDQFVLESQTLDHSIMALVQKILPTATQFVAINMFISTRLMKFEYGKVSHALCGAMDLLIQEYMEYLIQLDESYRSETGLTLSALWGSLQSCIRSISILSAVVEVARCHKGGALLNGLEVLRQEYLGDDHARKLFRFLLEKAAVPYMEMLQGWLKDGTLKDPFTEFMVEENCRMKRQDFCYSIGDGSVDQWPHWYSLREEHVLNVMKTATDDWKQSNSAHDASKNLALKILTTGKYWNATMLCEHRDLRAVQIPKYQDRIKTDNDLSCLSYGMTSAEVSRYVNIEYESASRTFLNIFLRDYRTLDALAFMKQYFLLDQGDFFVHFLDMAEEELLQEMSDVSRGRVQNWMTLSIQMSGGYVNEGDLTNGKWQITNKPPKEIVSSLTGAFATESLISHLDALHAMSGGISSNEPRTPSRQVYGSANKGLTGVEAFMLDFHTVPFPLSLILSRHSIANYQLMFRHLFFAKHVERRLVGTWLDHQVIKEYHSLRKDLGKTYFLRQRMLHFMQNFVYYMMFEVIEPNYLQMETKLLGKNSQLNDEEMPQDSASRMATVDDVLSEHRHFLQKTLSECLLTNRDLVRTLTKLMTTCLLFSDQMKLFIEQTQIVSTQYRQMIHLQNK
jgi:gamma-tubulin complex component 2